MGKPRPQKTVGVGGKPEEKDRAKTEQKQPLLLIPAQPVTPAVGYGRFPHGVRLLCVPLMFLPRVPEDGEQVKIHYTKFGMGMQESVRQKIRNPQNGR